MTKYKARLELKRLDREIERAYDRMTKIRNCLLYTSDAADE